MLRPKLLFVRPRRAGLQPTCRRRCTATRARANGASFRAGMNATRSRWRSGAGDCNRRAGWRRPGRKRYGGGELPVMQQFILKEEMARARAPRFGGVGHRLGRANAHAVRTGVDEGAVHRRHPQRARTLVPGLQRTGRRLGSRQRADAGGARRRRLRGQRPEDLDERRAHLRLDDPAGAHRPDAPKHKGSATFCST